MSLDARQDTLATFYGRQYSGGEHHDSPERTRVEIVQWFRKYVKATPAENLPIQVIDLGSGAQSLEVQLVQALGKETFINSLQIVTVDIAPLKPSQLLATSRGYPNVRHLQENALDTHLPHNSADVVISNMAEFMPREDFDKPFKHMHDLCKPGGILVANFHHPYMMENIDKAKGEVRNHWEYLRDNDVLFSSEEQIVDCLTRVGLEDVSVALHQDADDKWWAVEAHKPMPA